MDIALAEQSKFLHILSFDKDDNLIKDFNTTDLAYSLDITETDYRFILFC
jgi:predicted nucleic acid-binding protein